MVVNHGMITPQNLRLSESRSKILVLFCFFQLQREVVQVGSLLETAITANPNAMRMYTPTILTTLLPLLQSPLTASVMIPVLVKLGKSAFNDDQEHLGKRRLPVSF